MPKLLTELHEAFIEKAHRPMSFGALPIKARGAEVPVIPMDRWREADGSLFKTYKFRTADQRDRFVVALLSYERDVQHNASIRIDEGEVSLKVQTKTAERVTELDKEYARFADCAFKDIVSRPNVVVGFDDGDGDQGGDL